MKIFTYWNAEIWRKIRIAFCLCCVEFCACFYSHALTEQPISGVSQMQIQHTTTDLWNTLQKLARQTLTNSPTVLLPY